MTRWWLIAVLLGTGVLGLLAFAAGGEHAGDGWICDVAREAERGRTLDQALATLNRLREERLRIALALDQGTIDFDEAMQQTRALNADDPLCWTTIHTKHPDRTEEELLCYQLLVAVDSEPWPPARRQALLRRLIRRLEQHFPARPLLLPPAMRMALDRPTERITSPPTLRSANTGSREHFHDR